VLISEHSQFRARGAPCQYSNTTLSVPVVRGSLTATRSHRRSHFTFFCHSNNRWFVRAVLGSKANKQQAGTLRHVQPWYTALR
jgi:hypothetical protein